MSVLQKTPGPGQISLQDDRDHAAETAHLLLRKFVLRMLLEPRVINLLNLRLLLQPSRDFHRVLAMPLHAQSQCFQSAKREEAVERPSDCADGVLEKGDLVTKRLVF